MRHDGVIKNFFEAKLLTLKKDRDRPEIRRDGHQNGQSAGGNLLTLMKFFITDPLTG
jgi:hypothetical protein